MVWRLNRGKGVFISWEHRNKCSILWGIVREYKKTYSEYGGHGNKPINYREQGIRFGVAKPYFIYFFLKKRGGGGQGCG